MESKVKRIFLGVMFAAASAALAACGGGGGGGPLPPSGCGSACPTSTPTATPTPTPTPSATPSSVIAGKVVDYNTNAPIAGAHVLVVDLANIAVAAQPPAVVTVTTQADGSFTTPAFSTANLRVVYQSGTPYNVGVVVVGPSGSSYAMLHTWYSLSAGTTTLKNPLTLVQPTSQEQAWLTQVNADRSANGASPVILDSLSILAARWKVADMIAKNYCDHTPDPTIDYYDSIGGIIGTNENLDCGDVTWQNAESTFMAEKATNGGHYLNIVNPNNVWIGLGIQGSVYAQEFNTTF
jgi:hypothetical protein